jgi:WD40 repeat protein
MSDNEFADDEGEEMVDLDENDAPPSDDSDGGEDPLDELPDDSTNTFSQHKEPVFCVDILKDSGVVATGGQDDMGYVWDSVSDTRLVDISGHKDSVVVAKFSPDGKFLLTADMAGFIQVFDTAAARLHWSHDCESDLELAIWHPAAPVIIVGLSCGDCYMLKVGSTDMKFYMSGDKCGVSAAVFVPQGTTLLAGYAGGFIRQWDLKSSQCLWSMESYHGGHSKIVTGLCLAAEEGLFFTYSADGTFQYCNYVTGKVLWKANPTQDSPVTDMEEAGIECLVPCPSHKNLLALGRVSGRLEVWDISLKRLRNYVGGSHVLDGGSSAMVKIVFSATQPICLAATHSGVVFCYDALTGTKTRTFTGHQAGILDLCLSSDENFFVTSSEDSTVKLYHLT